jgi:hypothetical protein
MIDALDHYQQYHDQRLRAEGLSEDDISDLPNDRQYLQSIKDDLEKYRNDLLQQRQGVPAGD